MSLMRKPLNNSNIKQFFSVFVFVNDSRYGTLQTITPHFSPVPYMVLFYVAMVTHLGVLLGIDGLTAIREPHCLVSVMVAHLCVCAWVCMVGVGGVCVCVCGWCVHVWGWVMCVCVFGCMYVRHPPTQHNRHNSCAQQYITSSAANQIHLQILSTPTDCNHGNIPVGIRHIMNTGVTYE